MHPQRICESPRRPVEPRRRRAAPSPWDLRRVSLGVALGIALCGPASAATPEVPAIETVSYTIVRGDTCAGIAGRMYGDSRRWDIIHEFNPRLGLALPHRLVPGERLDLPPEIPPDAWVTEIVQRVEHRPGAVEPWRPARDGTPLSMGYRVNTHVHSAARLTFRDASEVELHENTLLVIYGRTASETQQAVNRVRLDRGTLRGRLAELRGEAPSTLRLESASAVATMGGGDAMMSADGGRSAVSNHGGAPIAVSGSAGGRAVAVSAGMGTTVERGRPPAEPRPLPDPPRWSADGPTVFAAAAGARSLVELRWPPRDDVVRYRLELERDGARIAAAELPPAPTSTTLGALPVGRYVARLRATDAQGLVSLPSAPRPFEVVAVADGAELPVGTPIAGCHGPDAPAPEVRVVDGDNRLICGGASLRIVGVTR